MKKIIFISVLFVFLSSTVFSQTVNNITAVYVLFEEIMNIKKKKHRVEENMD